MDNNSKKNIKEISSLWTRIIPQIIQNLQQRLQCKEETFTISHIVPPASQKIGVHAETTGPQKDLVRRGLANILPKLDKHLCGLELHFIPVLNHKTDNNFASRLRNESVKHDQIASDAATYEIEGITNIDCIIPNTPNLTLRKLIMDIEQKKATPLSSQSLAIGKVL